MQVSIRRRVAAVTGLAVLALAGGPAAGAGHAALKASTVQGARVVIDNGAVRGVTEGRAQKFLGLPFAAPPVRELRFAPPARPADWSGVRPADRQSPACLQFEPTGVREEQAVSEDCLYLDVYRPRTARRRSGCRSWCGSTAAATRRAPA